MKEKGFSIIILVIIIGVIGVTIFVLLKTQVAGNKSLSFPEVTNSPEVEQKAIRSTYPNKYVNTLYGYSIQYPDDWSIEAIVPGGLMNEPTGEDQGIILRSKVQGTTQINIEVDGPSNTSRGNYNVWVDALSKNQYYSVNKKTNIQFAGVDAMLLEGVLEANDPVYVSNILFADSSKTNFYSLTMNHKDNDLDTNNLLQKISQTFELN